MSLYVVSANQELLWNVISKNSYIQTFFAQYNPDRKIEWFKTIISNIYEKYKNRRLTVSELNNINKETIAYMIQNVRDQTTSTSNPTSPTNNNPEIPNGNSYSINTPPIVTNNRQDIYTNQFEQRQKEYELMNKRKMPDDVDFTEKNDDGVIENMDTLLQQQLKQREYDMNNIPPPTNMGSHPNLSNIPNNAAERPKLHIDTDSTINISIQEFDQPNNKKSVSWKDDTKNTDNAMTLMQDNIRTMSQNIIQLTKTVETLQNDMKLLQHTDTEIHTQYIRQETKSTIDTMLENVESL